MTLYTSPYNTEFAMQDSGVIPTSRHLTVIHRYMEPSAKFISEFILCRFHPLKPLLFIIALGTVKSKVLPFASCRSSQPPGSGLWLSLGTTTGCVHKDVVSADCHLRVPNF
ncbi:hypothetical protein E2C01_019232 [Portunus trituberculatus]|uniref:Uncharacterized protein n=1 Tax=Portunus trituberculatus TaxID=210409 RepID=A0A5B7DWP5_PORTR|nr:hypothetical protein [Portunus trituberculatus]